MKSALFKPEESCTEIRIRSFPRPPLPKLLSWKLHTPMRHALNVRKRTGHILVGSFCEAIEIYHVMDRVHNVERIDASSVDICLGR